MELLEHEADSCRADRRALCLPQRAKVMAIDEHCSEGRVIKGSQDRYQGGFARTGCTDDRELITCVDAQPRGVQRGDVRCARIRLGRPANFDNWFPGTPLDLRRVRGGHREITTSSPGSN